MKPTAFQWSTVVSALIAGALTTHAQVTAVTTTTAAPSVGTIQQYAPGSELVIRSETAPEPVRYFVTRETRFVDEAGAPVTVERILPGAAVQVEVTRTGDRVIAQRVIVRKAPAIEERTTTTTTTVERPLTREEREHAEKIRKAEKEHAEKVREADEERAEKLRKAEKD